MDNYLPAKTQQTMLACPQIMLIGHPNDVYKIIFWTKDKRACRIELKAPLNANQFGRPDKPEFEQMLQPGFLARLVKRQEARRILLTMPFRPGTGLNETTYTFVLGMLRDQY